MQISHKPKDLLSIVDVLSNIFKIASNNKEKNQYKTASKVLQQTCINTANISQHIQNISTSTLH